MPPREAFLLIILLLGSQRTDCFLCSFCPIPARVFIANFFYFFHCLPKPFFLQDPKIPCWFKNQAFINVFLPHHYQARLEGTVPPSTTMPVLSVCVSVSFQGSMGLVFLLPLSIEAFTSSPRWCQVGSVTGIGYFQSETQRPILSATITATCKVSAYLQGFFPSA